MPVVGLTANWRYLLPETALASVVPEKFVELNPPKSTFGVKPAPRERVPVLSLASVVVDAIVASLPVLPCASQARMTLSTNGAAGSTSGAVLGDAALEGATLATVGSKPKNSFTVSKNAMPEFGDALVVMTSVRPMTRLNTTERTNVGCDELKGLDIKMKFDYKRGPIL